MPTFTYRAADRRGQTIEGVMEAADARGVVERLQRDAYFPVKVSPQAERRSALGISLPGLGRGRISRRDVLTFTHQLGTLVEAGLPLDRALVILEDLAPNPRLRLITSDLLKAIRIMTTSFEVSVCTTGEWERAILMGYAVWKQVREHQGGKVELDLDRRTIRYLGM